MDKQKVTSFIRDEDLKIKMYHIVDLCNLVSKKHIPKNTDFLNPFEVKTAVSIINSEPDLKYIVDGGYPGCERAIIHIFPYYCDMDSVGAGLRFLEIKNNDKFGSANHRDYMGALLSLGIRREKIGDILVHENYCQIVVDEEICDFLLYNFKKVKKSNVDVREIHRELVEIPQQNYKESSVSVSSLRIDSVVASAYNLSRSESIKLVNSELIQLNYEKITQPSFQVEENSVVSVRGYGKFLIKELGGISKKGKFRLSISKYL